jgi:hypothetical protein
LAGRKVPVARSDGQIALDRIDVVMAREDNLFEVIRTFHSARCLASSLNGRQKKADQNADDGNDDKKFDERKSVRALHQITSWVSRSLLSLKDERQTNELTIRR